VTQIGLFFARAWYVAQVILWRPYEFVTCIWVRDSEFVKFLWFCNIYPCLVRKTYIHSTAWYSNVTHVSSWQWVREIHRSL
jgi:hypothetical protein